MPYKRAKNAGYARKVPATHAMVDLTAPSMEQVVRRIAAKGATDDEFEAMYGLPRGTLDHWKRGYKGFAKALEEGRSKADGDVLYALYRNAVGYEYHEEQAVGGKYPEVLEVKRKYHGQFSAQKYWLNNRQPEVWKSRERHEHAGDPDSPIGLKIETRNDLIDSIVALVASKPDGKTKPEKPSNSRE